MKRWEVEQGKEKGAWALKGETPGVWSGFIAQGTRSGGHAARSPRPPASQPSALLSSVQAWGRDPAEGDTAPPGRLGVEARGGASLPPASCISPLRGSRSSRSRRGDPHEGKPLCAPFSCCRLPGSQRLEREPRGGLFGSACLQAPF